MAKAVKKVIKKESKKESKKQVLEVYANDCELIKDGINIIVASGSGFYNEKRDNAQNKYKITVE